MVKNYSMAEVIAALAMSWDEETARGDWDSNCPSMNQCAITALIVQDYFGGIILRCLTSTGDSHYFNELGDGKRIDLTAGQFLYTNVRVNYEVDEERSRKYILSFKDTLNRYHILANRVSRSLQKIRESWNV